MLTKQELLRQVEELSRRVEEAERETQELKGSGLLQELSAIRKSESRLKEKLREADERVKELEGQLTEATEELDKANQTLEVAREQAEADAEVSQKLHQVNYQLDVTNEELLEAREAADWAEWQLEQAHKQFQYDMLRAKETLRAEMQQMHARDLDARDELIAMLKAKLAEKEGYQEPPKQYAVKGSSRAGERAITQKSDKSPKEHCEKGASAALHPPTDGTVSPTPSAASESQLVVQKMRLPALPKMNGEDKENSDSFDLWLQKLEKHAELEQWSDRQKLLQFELHLVGKAEKIYNVLDKESKKTYASAMKALRNIMSR